LEISFIYLTETKLVKAGNEYSRVRESPVDPEAFVFKRVHRCGFQFDNVDELFFSFFSPFIKR